MTVRNGEVAPDAITALWKDDQLERFEVQPLDEGESGALLAAVLGGPVDSSSLRRMQALARGNVLFLRQLVEEERRADRLCDTGGVWRWTGGPIVSPQLADLIAARIGLLPGRVAEVIDLLALGEPLGISLLGRLTDPMAVEEAETHGLLRVERVEGRLRARLAHPLFGEVRRTGLGRLRARRLRGQIAQGLADHPTDLADGICHSNEACAYRHAGFVGSIADFNECEPNWFCGISNLTNWDYWGTNTRINDETSSIWNRFTRWGLYARDSFGGGGVFCMRPGQAFDNDVIGGTGYNDNISSFWSKTTVQC